MSSQQGAEPAPFWNKLPRLSQERPASDRAGAKPGGLPAAPLSLDEARAEAERTLFDARSKAEAIREEARQQGYAAGAATARQEVEAELRAIWDRQTFAIKGNIQAIIDSIIEAREELWHETEQEMVALVLDIARKVIKTEVKQNPEVIVEMIRHAMRRVVDKDSIRIRVSPEDVGVVREQREDLLRILDGIRHLEIDDDRRIGRGGCVIETNAGTIDARVETQFEEVEEALKAA